MWMTFKGPDVTKHQLLDRIKVYYSNWKCRNVTKAYKTMSKALQSDPTFAISWQCNIAMPILDGAKGKLTPSEANAIADQLMQHLWGVKQ